MNVPPMSFREVATTRRDARHNIRAPHYIPASITITACAWKSIWVKTTYRVPANAIAVRVKVSLHDCLCMNCSLIRFLLSTSQFYPSPLTPRCIAFPQTLAPRTSLNIEHQPWARVPRESCSSAHVVDTTLHDRQPDGHEGGGGRR